MLRSQILLALMAFGCVTDVSGQATASGSSDTPPLTIEVVRPRQPVYLEVPGPGASSSVNWDAEIEPKGALWTSGLLSFHRASPDSLKVNLSRAELATPVPGPADFKWQPVAEYVLALKEGAVLESVELAALNVRQVRIVPAKSQIPNPPEVVEARESVEVSDILETARNQYRIELRNVSNQPIRGIFCRRYWRGQPIEEDHAGTTVAPGETLKIIAYVNSGTPPIRIEITSVLFEDGSCDGEPGGCARMEARREGRLLAAKAELPVLREALENPDAERLLDALSKIVVDNRVKSRLIERLALRYPGRIDDDLEPVLDDFSRHFRSWGEGFRQLLDRSTQPGMTSRETLAGHVREQIRQCERIIDRDGWY